MIVPVPKSTKSWLASLTDDIAAGAFAGVVSRMLTAPLDVVKIRYQINHNNIVSSPSMWHAMRGIVREEGITALWKGNVPALCLWVSYGAIQFALYSALKKLLAPDPSESKGGEGNGNAVMGMRAFRLFCAGAIASTTATFLTYPFDIIRTQLAIQGNARTFHSMTAMASHAISSKGLPGLYVGMGPALLTITPYMGMNFAMYEFLNNLAKDAHGNTTSGWVHVVQKGALGGIAGGASKLAVYPLDTIKKRMQASTLGGGSSSMLGTVHKLYTTDGLRGFYRGIVPTTAKAITATAVTFAAYEGAKEFLTRRSHHQSDADQYSS